MAGRMVLRALTLALSRGGAPRAETGGVVGGVISVWYVARRPRAARRMAAFEGTVGSPNVDTGEGTAKGQVSAINRTYTMSTCYKIRLYGGSEGGYCQDTNCVQIDTRANAGA